MSHHKDEYNKSSSQLQWPPWARGRAWPLELAQLCPHTSEHIEDMSKIDHSAAAGDMLIITKSVSPRRGTQLEALPQSFGRSAPWGRARALPLALGQPGPRTGSEALPLA